MEHDLTIVPVLNKVDLPTARPDDVIAEMETAVGVVPADVLRASGKTGLGVDGRARRHHRARPAAAGRDDNPLKALVYNSHFDTYKGVVVYVRDQGRHAAEGPEVKLMRDGRSTTSSTSACSAPA